MSAGISYRNEVFRKLIHLSSLWMVFSIWFFPAPINALLFGVSFVSLIVVEYGNHKKWALFTLLYGRLFNRVLRDSEKQEKFRISGAPYVLLAAFLVVILFPNVVAMTALSVMLIGDTAAALIGRQFGRHKINNQTKSVEGSLAFWISSFCVLLFFYFCFSQKISFLIFGALGITAAMLAEIFEKQIHIDDNFSIPMFTGFILAIPFWL